MKNYKPSQSRYLIPGNISQQDLINALEKKYLVEKAEVFNEHLTIVDSFEWSFYQKDMMAFRLKNNHVCIWEKNCLLEPDKALIIKAESAKARFWWDYAEVPEKLPLKSILGLRAFMPYAECKVTIDELNLQDDGGKTMVFCQLLTADSLEAGKPAHYQQLKLSSSLGYEEDYAQAEEIIKKLGCFTPALKPLDSILNAVGVKPKPYTVKPEISFDPATPSRMAVNSIIRTMLEKQRLTENGIIQDIDTEFLHHYRVAVRMIRAAIAQLKEVYPEHDVAMLKERFGKIGRETNHLRDLDVFILDRERYLNLLPDALKEGLLPMFEEFQNDRQGEVKRIAKWLSGAAYKKEIEELEAMFQNGFSACETRWSEKPVIDLAVSKIVKRYKKIQKLAGKITSDTPDEAIHSIRIECKKLRYLLYFFDGLFDRKKVKQAGKQLKRLQDTLGTFNDLTVQGHYLESYLDEIEHKKEKDIGLIASLGGLIATLHSMELVEREKCIAELSVFSSSKNQELFDHTFVN